ncbi:diphosphomevalonate decarboxylase [Alkalispirochaeta americana]|uniref:diphosphomevalonate decarboxylase n=1 Tax=Alkalispirochaeta americana TaxID=159291 RepID=A0A1N6SF70_9SPIO|nr:diphosphomevalonate decarboxylase [Alkalispirochaeta americana]SIQ39768.1 diphosphomevalonate decarboxylase [Alkalispirochaeta americana]
MSHDPGQGPESFPRTISATAHPSLAVAKYWGKQTGAINTAATPSVAITLGAIAARTTLTVDCASEGDQPCRDQVVLNGVSQDPRRFRPFFDAVREVITLNCPHQDGGSDQAGECLFFTVRSDNDFPTAAGLASSAAGFAALAASALTATLGERPPEEISRLARIGSGSACRSVYGGFTRWDAGAPAAEQLYPETWWPDLRVVVLPVSSAEKPLSSRDAMNRTRDTSPFYDAWVADAPSLAGETREAIAQRDLERLGQTARLSYLRMFSTMFAAAPPIMYWLPQSLEIIRGLEELRRMGLPVWETMDAGPQVKVITDAAHARQVAEEFRDLLVSPAIISEVGPGVTVGTASDRTVSGGDHA